MMGDCIVSSFIVSFCYFCATFVCGSFCSKAKPFVLSVHVRECAHHFSYLNADQMAFIKSNPSNRQNSNSNNHKIKQNNTVFTLSICMDWRIVDSVKCVCVCACGKITRNRVLFLVFFLQTLYFAIFLIRFLPLSLSLAHTFAFFDLFEIFPTLTAYAF